MANAEQSMIAPSVSPEMRSIFDKHFALVWRYMAQRGVPRDQVDDLVNNVFRVVREHPVRRQDRVRLRVLVCTACFQVLRAYQKGVRSTARGVDDSEEPTENFGESASFMVLDSAIDALSEAEREVYLLCEGEQIPFEEVAESLGITETSLLRKYAKAKEEVGGFVANVKGHLLSGESPANNARDLLLAARASRTPNRADHSRVLTAFIAASITSFGRPALQVSVGRDAEQERPESPPVGPARASFFDPLPHSTPTSVEEPTIIDSLPPEPAFAPPKATRRIPPPAIAPLPASLHLPAPQVAASTETSVVMRLRSGLHVFLSIFGFGKARWGRRVAWAAAVTAVLALWGWSYAMVPSTRASGKPWKERDDLVVAEEDEIFDEENLSGDDELADDDDAQPAAQDVDQAESPTQAEAEQVITVEPSESDEDVPAAADTAQAGNADPAEAPSDPAPPVDDVVVVVPPVDGHHEPHSAPEDAVEPGKKAGLVVAEGAAPTPATGSEELPAEAADEVGPEQAAATGGSGAGAPRAKPAVPVAASPQAAARKPASRGASADLQLLRLAGQRYRQGANEATLALLERHEERFPASRNRLQRSALQAQALCAEGEHERAREIALDLESQSAAPSLLLAVGRACL